MRRSARSENSYGTSKPAGIRRWDRPRSNRRRRVRTHRPVRRPKTGTWRHRTRQPVTVRQSRTPNRKSRVSPAVIRSMLTQLFVRPVGPNLRSTPARRHRQRKVKRRQWNPKRRHPRLSMSRMRSSDERNRTPRLRDSSAALSGTNRPMKPMSGRLSRRRSNDWKPHPKFPKRLPHSSVGLRRRCTKTSNRTSKVSVAVYRLRSNRSLAGWSS